MSQAIILPQYPGDFSLDGHTHNYASSSHTHSQYLTSHQSLTNYATKTYVDNAVAGIDTSTVPSHTHDYASSSHTHSYASTSHTHSGYASSSHSHSGYASSSHTHSASDISGLSTGGGGGEPFAAYKLDSYSSATLSSAASFIISIVLNAFDNSMGFGLCFPGSSPKSSNPADMITAKLSSNGRTITSNSSYTTHVIAFA